MKMREGVKRKKGKMGEFWFVCGEKELLKKIPYSISVKCCAWGGKSVVDLKNEQKNAAEIDNMHVKGNEE